MTVEAPSTTPAAPAAAPAATTPLKRHEEYQYLDLVRDILENGELRRDRYAPFLTPPFPLII